MKKLLFQFISASSSSSSSSTSISKCICNFNKNPRIFFFSTEAKPLISLFPSPYPTDEAFSDQIMAVDERNSSVIPIMQRWVTSGRPVELENVRFIIRGLRRNRRFKHALQIFEWIDETKCVELSPGDIATRLDLIGKVWGIEAAENYFDSIPNDSRSEKVYAALLHCYAKVKSVGKAEAILQKLIDDFNYDSCLAFNNMMNLYYEVGNFTRLHALAQEVEEKGVIVNSFFYSIRLRAYATDCDVKGMEAILKKMNSNPLVILKWNIYAMAAKGYIGAGDPEKALAALRKCERLTSNNRGEKVYDFLLTLYASMGRKADVYRIWNMYEGVGKVNNDSYLCMISSLDKLDDLENIEKTVEEWESWRTYVDIRIPNFLVHVYCKRGNLGKAEMVIKRAIESGAKLSSGMWGRMARGYCENEQMEKAVDAMTKAIFAFRGGKIMMSVLASCLVYLESKGDYPRAEYVMNLLRNRRLVSRDFDQRLEDYIRNEKTRGSLDHVLEETFTFTDL